MTKASSILKFIGEKFGANPSTLPTENKTLVGGLTEVANKATQNATNVGTLTTNLNTLTTRVDEIIAPSGEAPNPAEVVDARIGADGVTYNNLGTANRTQFSDVKSALNNALKENQEDILEQGNISSTTGKTSNSTAHIRTSEYLDINLVKVSKPSGVGMSIYYYANPTSSSNGFLTTGSWSRNASRSGNLYDAAVPTATHVKIRFDITGTDPILPSDIITAGVQITYLISSSDLKALLENTIQSLNTLDTSAYKQFVFSNSATSIMEASMAGFYRCKPSVASNLTDAPSTGGFSLIVMDSLGGAYLQQIYINGTQEIYIRIINITDPTNPTVYRDWAKVFPHVAPENGGSILSGKKWVACGDSFTHGDFTGVDDITEYQFQNAPYQNENMVYPFFIGRRTGANVINEAVNGSTMGYKSGLSNCFSATNGRYTQIPSDADYITLYFGINDGANHKNIPLGTINDNTNETFYGAWNVVMTYLIANHPNAKIGIIISNGCDSIDIPNAEIEIAKKYGVAYLDMNGDPKIPLVFRTNGKNDFLSSAIKNLRFNQYKVSDENGHPNVACHSDESTFIQAWLERI